MSREQGNKMLCWNGEGGRKPPCITESGLAVQRASPTTLSAGDAGAQPPSAQLLTHLPWLSSTENVDRFQRPVHTLHTSPLTLALTDACAWTFPLNLLGSGWLGVQSGCSGCVDPC